jgi:aspartate/methionine/tyrosine aminotransferase
MSLTYRLSQGVLNTITPPVPLASAWAASYIPQPGRPLINMSQGAPGILPPQLLSDALSNVVRRGKTGGWGYGPWNGEKELREALLKEMNPIYGRGGEPVEVNEDDVAITAGCNMASVAVIMSVASHGDEVILPVPWLG